MKLLLNSQEIVGWGFPLCVSQNIWRLYVSGIIISFPIAIDIFLGSPDEDDGIII